MEQSKQIKNMDGVRIDPEDIICKLKVLNARIDKIITRDENGKKCPTTSRS